ncbi:MAG: hypothetical protein L7F77_00240 [Candidatus Magnetominusculus sp. LBB02]|nr:hypothetical protein [Candidatus Magnetominusculus sp. LBB02]
METICCRGGLSVLPEWPSYELIAWPFQFKFSTLGRFEIINDGKPVVSKGKSQKTVLALLKALIAFGTVGVSDSYIADILWPDADGDDVHISLKTTIHRLRQFLGNNEAVIYSDQKIMLDFRYCQSDCLQGIEVDDLAENFYKSLIVCYGRMGLPMEAHRTYNRFCDLLQSKLGIRPNFKIDAIMKN